MKSLVRRLNRRARTVGKALWALADRTHPVLAHVIPMRRCNLSCTYCNEYDAVSKPVPLETMRQRLDKLADLGTSMITVSGGEPLMHPDLDPMIAHMRARGMIASLITNGYYLNQERIERLNRAGLDYLQISIDNVEPDAVSLKSLRLLEPKLEWLARHAEFGVNINSVVGSGIANPEDALAVARRARELGFTSTIGILHDGRGQLRALAPREMKVYEDLKNLGSRGDARVNASFQDNLARGKPNQWSCRAGSRYLYVDEDGLVHYCSQMRGVPGIPLADYTRADLEREYGTRKACAPYCTINCAQRVALLDNWRSPQTRVARLVAPPPGAVPAGEARGRRVGPGRIAALRRRRGLRASVPVPGMAEADRDRPPEDFRALVTGASSGIGEAFARALSARGRRLVLVARRGDRLARLARDLGGDAPAVTLDLARPGAEDELWSRVSAAGIQVDLLVNNAGVGHTGRFAEEPADRLLAMVDLNARAVVGVSRRFLPAMVERRRGAIVNVVSMSAFQPVPFLATYAATKAFVLSLTEALALELEGSGVTVQALCPGNIPTEFQQVAGTERVAFTRTPSMSPAAVAEASLRALDARRVVVIPGARDRMMVGLQRFAPRRLVLRIAAGLFRPPAKA